MLTAKRWSSNLLVNPVGFSQGGYTPPPLGLLFLAAMDPDTRIVDAAIGEDPFAYIELHRPRVVGVPIYTPQRHDSLEVLRFAKAHGCKTVAGGPHVGLMLPQLVENYGFFVDHFCVGDGERFWRDICRGDAMPDVYRDRGGDLDQLPLPAWDRVNYRAYPARGGGIFHDVNLTTEPRIPVIFGRGCNGSCTFCSTWWVQGKYRHHSLDWMTKHLAQLWDMGVRHLCFSDDCLTADREASLALFRTMAANWRFAFHGTTRADSLDDELAVAAAAAGCYQLAFGIESGSPTILAKMNKKTSIDTAFVAREACRKAGIWFTALIMTGYPGETAATRTEDAAFRAKLKAEDYGTTGAVWVFPGTALYQQCKRAGLIDDSFWLGEEPYYVYRGGLTDAM